MLAPSIIAGIDVGGTSTRVALADAEGRLLGRGRGAGAGFTEVSVAESARRLRAAWGEACAGAKRDASEPVEAVFAGFGSLAARRDEVVARKCLRLAGIRARRLLVGHDSENAQAGARPGGAGVHVIAGTGSVVAARDAEGRMHRVGGWGPGVGDEGAAWWLAAKALGTLASRADAGETPGALEEALMRALKIGEPRELLQAVFARNLDRAAFAGLARPVLALAKSGDRRARALLQKGAAELGAQVALAARRAGLSAPVVTVSGGMFEHAAGYARRVVAAARREGVGARLAKAEACPLAGALLLARRAAFAGRGDPGAAREDLVFVRRLAGVSAFNS